MSPRLMSLLIVCFVSSCHCSAFSTRCIAKPAPCPIPTFFSKVQPCKLLTTIAQYIAASNLMRFCLFSNLISAENPFLPAQESTLIHFFTHLSSSLSYGTIKVYLAAVKKLHIEFGCLQDLSSMSLLQCIYLKTLHDIKSFFGIL